MITSQKNLDWLRAQLPDWIENNFISAGNAEKLLQHCQAPKSSERGRSWGVIACGLAGAALIGLGLILLVAHNWDQLTRAQRIGAAYLPLLLGLALCAWTLARKQDSTAWRESCAAFLTLAAGATLALVSQTYHILPDKAAFIMTCLALTAPLAYLFNSSAVASLTWISLLFWAGSIDRDSALRICFWPAAAAMLPHLWLACKRRPAPGARVLYLCWCLGATLLATPILLPGNGWRGLWILLYPALFAVMKITGAKFEPASGFWRRPFSVLGAEGQILFALIFSISSFWLGISYWEPGYWTFSFALVAQDMALAFLLLGLAFILPAICRLPPSSGQSRWTLASHAILPALALAGYAARWEDFLPKETVALAFSVYLFAFGAAGIRQGIRRASLGRLNSGLALVGLAVATRLFDGDVSAVARGLAFMILGAGFLACNLWMLRRRREAAS